ncbi:MAG: threonine synthase [Halanaerobiales bacterium]|nr:threonine synthase [Halanaerobiales bacterium]
MKYVKNLKCTNCGKTYEPLPDKYLCDSCEDQGILDVQYHYDKIKKDWDKESLKNNDEQSIWRYLPLLPIKEDTKRPNLRIGHTPTYRSEKMGKKLGLDNLIIKDDGLNPTGSLKDRASAMAAVKAREANADTVACSSTGNAASSLAGNIAAMDDKMKAVIFVPERAPAGKVTQLLIYGAEVVSVQDSYEAAYYLSDEAIRRWGWYNRNAAINPYLVEGKKTAAIEMAEQLDWEIPDWVVFSVGDGCTIAGAYKGFYDLKQIGFTDKIPKLLGVQAKGCAPITKAFKTGNDLKVTEENTIADSIAVGSPRNYKKALNAVKKSNGDMINVSDQKILTMIKTLGSTTGIFGEPAGVTGLAGIKEAVKKGIIKSDQKVAVVITGNGLKDIDNARKATGDLIEIKADIDILARIFSKKGVI